MFRLQNPIEGATGEQLTWIVSLVIIAFACCFGVLVWGIATVLQSHCFA